MKKRFPLKKQSAKGRLKKQDYTAAYKAQDQGVLDEFGYLFCVSCLSSNIGGGHSHNMPVAHYKELESDPRNFALRCMECHNALDYPNFQKIVLFRDFHNLMAYRKEKDIYAFNKWVSCLLAIGYTEYQYIQE